MLRILLVFHVLLLGFTLQAQESNFESTNKVPGLTLPANFAVPTDEGFVNIKAECAGAVEWLVLTTATKVKYKVSDQDKEVIIGVPNKPCVVSVFCFGVVDSKPTKVARCDITVTENNAPRPPPDPPITPPNVVTKGPYVITVIEDPLKRTPDMTLITNWLASVTELKKLGHKAYLVSSKDPAIINPANGFDKLLSRFPLPILVIQDPTGKLLGAGPCPKTLDELLKMLQGA